MKTEIKKLIKTFESDNKGRKRYADFLQHCWSSIQMPKRRGNNKRVINMISYGKILLDILLPMKKR